MILIFHFIDVIRNSIRYFYLGKNRLVTNVIHPKNISAMVIKIGILPGYWIAYQGIQIIQDDSCQFQGMFKVLSLTIDIFTPTTINHLINPIPTIHFQINITIHLPISILTLIPYNRIQIVNESTMMDWQQMLQFYRQKMKVVWKIRYMT